MAWAPDYASLIEVRSYATRSTVTADDVELALAVTAASRAIDRATNRQFGLVEGEDWRLYIARWDQRRRRWVVDIDDLMTTSMMTITTGGQPVDSFSFEPLNAEQVGRPWTLLVIEDDSTVQPAGSDPRVMVIAQWGWTTIPTPIKHATLLQANRFVSRRTSPYGIAGSPDQGGELRLLARLDPDVAVTLGPYIRWWGAA